MKILGLCTSLGKGGLELYSLRTIVSLIARGHDCHFALSPNSYLRKRNIPEQYLFAQPALRKLPLFTAFKLARYINKQSIDVIHLHWNKDLNLLTQTISF